MLEIVRNFVFGIIMAVGELVPGIGLQTVAIIIGIYDEIIGFLFEGTEFLKVLVLFISGKKSKEDLGNSFKAISWKFGMPIGIAVLLTIIILANITTKAFEVFPTEIAAAAFGIVLASSFIPFKEMKNKTWIHYLIILLTFIALYGLFEAGSITSGSRTDASIFYYFSAGIVASLAGFFPGISISFALLLLGLYEPLISNVGTFANGTATMYSFTTVAAFLIGLFIGLLLCVRLLAIMIQKFKSYFLALIVGLILASLRATWPFMNNNIAVAPWDLPISDFTKQLIIITIAVVTVNILRKMAEGKGTISSSFGDAKRKVLTK